MASTNNDNNNKTISSSSNTIPSITIHKPSGSSNSSNTSSSSSHNSSQSRNSILATGSRSGAEPLGRLRTRSPKGQRGRPRNTHSNTLATSTSSPTSGLAAPPINAHSSSSSNQSKHKNKKKGDLRYTLLNQNKWVYGIIALIGIIVVLLLISAVRIISKDPSSSSHQIIPTKKSSESNSRDSSRISPLKNSNDEINRGSRTKGGIVLDEVVRGALEDVWDLSKLTTDTLDDDADEMNQNKEGSKHEPADTKKDSGIKSRSLEELYAQMEQMGMSVDDLTGALNQAYRGD